MTPAAISGPPTALFSPEYYQNPYPTLTWLQENSPVHEFRFPVGDVPTWIVTRYEDVKTVLADPRYSAEAATYATPEFKAAGLVAAAGTILERGIAVVDPPVHTRLRRLAMKPFTTRRVQEWRETVRGIVARTLDECAERGGFDVMDDYAGEVAAKTLGEILGFRIERHRELVEALNQAFPSDPALIHEAPAAFGRICEYSAELVAEKRLHPGEDLTSALIQTSDDDGDRLDEDELVGMVAAIIMGGSDTVRGFIGNAVLGLLDHPDQAGLLRRSPELAGNAVEELLRYDGALSTALFRVTTEETELAGVKLPAGAPVIAGLLAANRDPRCFPAPETLDIARTGKRHVGFGHGLHNCMGAALARLEGEIAIHALFDRFPDLALDVPRDELRYIDSWAIRRLTALPVTTSATNRA